MIRSGITSCCNRNRLVLTIKLYISRASIKEVKRNIVIVEAKLYNEDGEVCTESVCTYFTFSKEKSKDEMHFTKCDVEPEEILPLI